MNKNAFTLIELAVVAICVGVLLLVGIPSMLKSINRNYAVDAMRNLVAIYNAEHKYAQEHGNYLITSDLKQLGLNLISTSGVVYSVFDLGFPSPTYFGWADAGSLYSMKINLDLPISTQTTPVYCNGDFPSNSYNPCCVDHAHSHVPGSLCPS